MRRYTVIAGLNFDNRKLVLMQSRSIAQPIQYASIDHFVDRRRVGSSA